MGLEWFFLEQINKKKALIATLGDLFLSPFNIIYSFNWIEKERYSTNVDC